MTFLLAHWPWLVHERHRKYMDTITPENIEEKHRTHKHKE